MQHKAEKENTGTANCNEVNNHLKLKPGERMRQREWFCYQLGESQRDVYMVGISLLHYIIMYIQCYMGFHLHYVLIYISDVPKYS